MFFHLHVNSYFFRSLYVCIWMLEQKTSLFNLTFSSFPFFTLCVSNLLFLHPTFFFYYLFLYANFFLPFPYFLPSHIHTRASSIDSFSYCLYHFNAKLILFCHWKLFIFLIIFSFLHFFLLYHVLLLCTILHYFMNTRSKALCRTFTHMYMYFTEIWVLGIRRRQFHIMYLLLYMCQWQILSRKSTENKEMNLMWNEIYFPLIFVYFWWWPKAAEMTFFIFGKKL